MKKNHSKIRVHFQWPSAIRKSHAIVFYSHSYCRCSTYLYKCLLCRFQLQSLLNRQTVKTHFCSLKTQIRFQAISVRSIYTILTFKLFVRIFGVFSAAHLLMSFHISFSGDKTYDICEKTIKWCRWEAHRWSGCKFSATKFIGINFIKIKSVTKVAKERVRGRTKPFSIRLSSRTLRSMRSERLIRPVQ